MSEQVKAVIFETKSDTNKQERKSQEEQVKNNAYEEKKEENVTENDEPRSENVTQEDRRNYLVKFKDYINAKIENQEFYVNPEGDVIFIWMRLVTFAVLYNFWMIILRITFKEMREEAIFRRIFGSVDIFCDAVCILDILFSNRVAYLEEGLIVKDPKKLAANYRKKTSFKLDILAVIPLGTIALFIGGASDLIHFNFDLDNDDIIIPLLRVPRLLKLHSMIYFFDVCDSRTSNPNRLRAFKLIMYLGIVIHWIGCIYYMISDYEGFGANNWAYPLHEDWQDVNFLSKYIRSMFWAIVTLTTIGGTNSPITKLEYVFTGGTYLIGVFLFAAVVGNVGDVISNMNAARQEFQTKMDSLKFYMNHRKVPEDLQSRVKKWSEYAWTRTQALDDQCFLDILPPRLRAEIAKHVHFETLQKVKIFEDCEQGLLCELVLKLRSQIHPPGDYICRKGEIGREMYIINHGRVSVMIQDKETGQNVTVATLREGNYFGEISLLKLDDGQNRRTADVVSVGYSELLCLSKKDLMVALVEYPDAKKVLEKHGRDRMEKNKEATLQRRKSEANLTLQENKDDRPKDPRALVAKPPTPADILRSAIKGKEMTELRHIIHELRTFDSMSTKEKIDQLAVKCDQLKVKLTKRSTDLRRALMRVSELENKVNSKLCNGRQISPQGLHEFKQYRHFYNRKKKQSSGEGSFTHDESGNSPSSKGHVKRKPKNIPAVKCKEKVKRRTVVIPGICINGEVQEEPRQFVFELEADELDISETSDENDGLPLPSYLLSVDSFEVDGKGAESDVCFSDSWESD